MSKKKASELTPIQRMGRRNKHRGYSTEVQLVNFLKKWGVFAKRVAMSGALKNVGVEQLRGDVHIEHEGKTIRVEVKSRKNLPRYVTNLYKKDGEVKKRPTNERVIKVKGLCYILDQDQFLEYLHIGKLPKTGVTIDKSECTMLQEWFEQDDCQVVAMKEYNQRVWYFAVRTEEIK